MFRNAYDEIVVCVCSNVYVCVHTHTRRRCSIVCVVYLSVCVCVALSRVDLALKSVETRRRDTQVLKYCNARRFITDNFFPETIVIDGILLL